MTLIAIDIDGTLSYRNKQQYIKTCNEALKLAIPEERLQDISLNDFYRLPEVLAYKERVGETYYTRAIGWIDFHSEVLQAMHTLPYAKEGVDLLASLGSVAYYTARYVPQDEERNQSMAQATYAWLASCEFVNPTSAVFCAGVLGKLQQLARDIARNTQPTILVDDQFTRLLEKFTDLDEEAAQILKRSLVLVAYGAQTVPEQRPIPVVALPSWERVSDIMETLIRLTTGEQEEAAKGVEID